MVPGSHRWGEARDIAKDWGLPEIPKVYHGNRVTMADCLVPAGYVHFHNELVWHSSVENTSRRPRRALAVHYIGADERHSADEYSEYPELARGAPMSEVLPILVSVA
jgi:ectoine hydroxylase-related dioxygenase (phytanoyl-CoA dioxygenase family)